MAYGLDIEELYYADENRYDLGALDTYSINIDTANEKDFEMKTPDMIVPVHGFWYIPNTEYGGYVDEYETDSDEKTVVYQGRTWRGLLNSHFVDFYNREKRTFTTGAGEPQFDIDGTPANNITDVINALLTETGTDDWFVCDEPLVDDSIDTSLTSCEVTDGATLYECICAIANSKDMSFFMEYKPMDKKIHITPILKQDYTEYMQYSNIATLGFQIQVNETVVNHVIITSIEEGTGERRTIHLFADENGNIQPYATVTNPIKDSQYILDKRNQRLRGIKEVADRDEINATTVENYEAMTTAPADWQVSFGKYYVKTQTINADTGAIDTSYEAVQAEEKTKEIYERLYTQPSDWATKYNTYYTRTWNPDYASIDVYIVGNVPYAKGWLSLTRGGNPIIPVENQLYRIAETSGQFAVDTYYEWDAVEEEYEETAGDRWNYSAVSGVNSLAAVQQITVIPEPADWKHHYTDYYYYYNTGTTIELRQYEAAEKTEYVLLTSKPQDWETNYTSYYRKVYKKVVYENVTLKNGKVKRKKEVHIVDCVDHKDAYYLANEQQATPILFEKNKYYKTQAKQVPPTYNPMNTYMAKTVTTAPSFGSDIFYKRTEQAYYDVPAFKSGEVYNKVLDHYADMVDAGVNILNEAKKTSTQKMFLDDFDVNIGDVVGGRDEMTGTQIIGEVTNVTATIESGILDVEYEVVIDAYQKGE